ncbi:MAG TPA: substrate-binding domain-containing protein [Candidatus Cryosericum sp.]|nr:substrate-binding domain-containing protein [Candidatus Cryosericum sp.]
MPQKKSNIYKTNLSILAIVVMAVITVASMFVYNGLINRKFKVDTTGNTYYTYHFALVAEAQDDPFWINVWTAANKEANRMDACVEWIGHSLTEQYPLTDQLEMAIAARVDGILIQPDGSDEVKALIQKAIGSNIPVITVMTDSPVSKRQGFVGYNSYDLGQLYGQQVRSIMAQSPNECRAVVLFGSDVSENTQNIVYSSIIESLEGQNITVDVLVIDNSNVFSAEEAIRELVVNPAESSVTGSAASGTTQMTLSSPPDILICLNATNTICAYQAVVDHNKVGEIQILGYYDSEEILTAVEKRIIQATVAVDANRVGTASVDSLMEYVHFNRTSDFTPVGLTVVTANNVDEYRAFVAAEQEGK